MKVFSVSIKHERKNDKKILESRKIQRDARNATGEEHRF